jgi:hypothetical protein
VGNLPTLKPREVVAFLQGLGFSEVRQRGSHNSFGTLMVEEQQSPFTKDATSRRHSCERSRRPLGSLQSNSWVVHRNVIQRTSHGQDGGSPLISVSCGR